MLSQPSLSLLVTWTTNTSDGRLASTDSTSQIDASYFASLRSDDKNDFFLILKTKVF